MSDQIVDLQELLELNQPIPRYTSYPTAPEWHAIESVTYEQKLAELAASSAPLSLYLHIPFCRSMCLYCACSVVLNRKEENEERYVQYIIEEIDLVAKIIGKKQVMQLHFGGGTPTQLSEGQFDLLLEKLHSSFNIDKNTEVAIEIDPRTVGSGEKLAHLRKLGFNRVSFGVQDTNSKVQEAVRRRQSYEVTRDTYYHARELGFTGINIDLIYGLPYQTVETFAETARLIIALRPDRIALFSYAKVPWLKPHQRAMNDETLPSTEEKFKIYLLARKLFIEAGYQPIGMDHFALKEDELAQAYKKRTLHRNFQGYTVFAAEDLLGFGMSSIGFVRGAYIQNNKELTEYYQALEEKKLPVHKGKVLTDDDHIRRFVIQRIMCHFSVDKQHFFDLFGFEFDLYFKEEMELIAPLISKSLVQNSEKALVATQKGELFIRNIAALFDIYLRQKQSEKQFSQSV